MRRYFSFIALAIFLFTSFFFAACSAMAVRHTIGVDPYTPKNIHSSPPAKEIIRLGLLPIVAKPELGNAEALNGIRRSITEELGKTKNFELVQITPDMLHDWADVSQLSSLDEWPETLKSCLQDKQIDGVMLIEITQLKGFYPITLGIKARLVGIPDGITYWACDEVFDAASEEVLAGAKNYEKVMQLEVQNKRVKTTGTIELSPSKFAKYAAWTLFQTLP